MNDGTMVRRMHTETRKVCDRNFEIADEEEYA